MCCAVCVCVCVDLQTLQFGDFMYEFINLVIEDSPRVGIHVWDYLTVCLNCGIFLHVLMNYCGVMCFYWHIFCQLFTRCVCGQCLASDNVKLKRLPTSLCLFAALTLTPKP